MIAGKKKDLGACFASTSLNLKNYSFWVVNRVLYSELSLLVKLE